ncbi:c-type cytochrome biogenesis protein CcsB [Cellulomonas sp. ATA003]|uniref:c-type cytochrome biogenesis protein CcsB n=1 Tax=Cellulomonas sp. ATA003 TaxID=3073064 RepID=UPI002873C927|nr:c-type cytochrome biogenesis protein CcsB [Cellulomonas sp. ATA003]WNB86983.1 c-type cytochrome biogenesis protein CcsB [Cellulomonas sp. ATA003]
MTPVDLGDISTGLVWGAVTVYTVALVAYTADLARLSERTATMRAEELALAAGLRAGHPTAVPTPDVPAPADRRRSKARGIARTTTVLGLALHIAAVILRAVAAGRVPWANMYEYSLVGTMVAVVVLVYLLRRRDLPFLGLLVTGLTVLALALALLVFYVQADGVQPALQSYWLVIHVGVAITATGVFTVAFAASVLQLLRDSRENGSASLARRGWRWLEAAPRAAELEALSFRLNAVGFVLWTFTLIAGAIWAEHAWGRYWGWDPKEVWTFVVWVVYAAYLHARTTRGWAGRRAAWFVLVGYGCVLANFGIVNLFFSGKHSYSGL